MQIDNKCKMYISINVYVLRMICFIFMIFMLQYSSAYAQKNMIAVEYGIVYTLPYKKYIQLSEDKRYNYKNPAETKFSLQYTRNLKPNLFYGVGLGVESYDFGLNSSFNKTYQDSFGVVRQVTGALGRSSELTKKSFKLLEG